MSDIKDAVDTEEKNTEAAGQEKTQVPQINKEEVASKVASILMEQTRRDAARIQAAQAPTFTQEELNKLRADGYTEEALSIVQRVAEAAAKDMLVVAHRQNKKQSNEQYSDAVWDAADEAFDKFAEQLEVLKYSEEGIKKRFYELANKDKDFSEKLNNKIKPTVKQVNEIMTKAVDEFCEKVGLQRRAAPVNLSSKTPAVVAGTRGGVASLDQNQRRLFNALKGTFGEDVAFDKAKTLYDED